VRSGAGEQGRNVLPIMWFMLTKLSRDAATATKKYLEQNILIVASSTAMV
jgi:hypothetical protein